MLQVNKINIEEERRKCTGMSWLICALVVFMHQKRFTHSVTFVLLFVLYYLQSTPGRQEFLSKISNLMGKIVEKYCPVDAACDQMGKQFLHDSLPPVLTEGEWGTSDYF